MGSLGGFGGGGGARQRPTPLLAGASTKPGHGRFEYGVASIRGPKKCYSPLWALACRTGPSGSSKSGCVARSQSMGSVQGGLCASRGGRMSASHGRGVGHRISADHGASAGHGAGATQTYARTQVVYPRRAGLAYSIDMDYSEASATLFDGKSTRPVIKGEFPQAMFDYTAKAMKAKALADKSRVKALALTDAAPHDAAQLPDDAGASDDEGEEEEEGGEEEDGLENAADKEHSAWSASVYAYATAAVLLMCVCVCVVCIWVNVMLWRASLRIILPYCPNGGAPHETL